MAATEVEHSRRIPVAVGLHTAVRGTSSKHSKLKGEVGRIEQMLLILRSVPKFVVLDHEGILADDWIDGIDDLKVLINEPVGFIFGGQHGNDFGKTTSIGPQVTWYTVSATSIAGKGGKDSQHYSMIRITDVTHGKDAAKSF